MSGVIERLLTEDGERWRDGLPPAPDPARLLLAARPRPRRTLPLIAASVLAVVAVSVGVAVLGPGGRGPTTTSLPAGFFTRPCHDQFVAGRATYAPTARPAFQNITVTLTYRGSEPCVISAYGPEADLRDAHHHVVGIASHTTLEAIVPETMTVSSGQPVPVLLRFVVACPATAHLIQSVVFHMGGPANSRGAGVASAVPDDYPQACDRAFPSRAGGYTALIRPRR